MIKNLRLATGLALLGLLGASQDRSPLELVQTILLPKVEGRIDHMAYDSKAQTLSIAALGNNTVEVLDLAAGKVVHQLPGHQEPQGVLSLNGEIVVASGGD